MEFIKKVFNSDGFKSVLSSLISILIGVFIGFLAMVIITFINPGNTFSDALQGVKIILSGPFTSNIQKYMLTNTGNMIFYAVPLIFTGLSVAIAYKTGLFNIGAPGQYIMGTIGSLYIALSFQPATRAEGVLIWILALLVGTVLGALWGIIPGVLKAFFNINEVIICIMTNWIAANLSSWFFKYQTAIQANDAAKGGYLTKIVTTYTPKLGLDKLLPGSLLDGSIVIAIIVAIIIYIILNKTTFGFELKACGSNKDASKYAGLNEKRNIIISIAIAGALAGMGASLYYLNPGIEYKYISQYAALPAYGFNGIASAFLANCNPIGTIFSSLFIRYLNIGGDYLVKVGFNRYVADIVVAVIIYMAGFTRIIKERLATISKKKIVEEKPKAKAKKKTTEEKPKAKDDKKADEEKPKAKAKKKEVNE